MGRHFDFYFRLIIRFSIICAFVFLGACGKLSNQVTSDFIRDVTGTQPDEAAPEVPVAGGPIFGTLPSSSIQTQGQFKLSAAVGSMETLPVKTSGIFKLYGGIKSEEFSK